MASVIGVVKVLLWLVKRQQKWTRLWKTLRTISTRYIQRQRQVLPKPGESYPLKIQKGDLTLIYVQTGVKFAKLYGPSVVLRALSITSILASNNILRKRNVALGAAYVAIDKGIQRVSQSCYRGGLVKRLTVN